MSFQAGKVSFFVDINGATHAWFCMHSYHFRGFKDGFYQSAIYVHVNKRYLCFVPKESWCRKLISWKHSFNRLNEEYEIAKKKKQALDNLYEKGRISQSTHDSFYSEVAVAIAEIEKQQQALIQKMQLKTEELESQIKTLEMLLANYEIQHVTGEIDEDTYQIEINLLANGLTTAKHELENVKDAVNQLCTPVASTPAAEPAPTPVVEVAPAQPAENMEVAVAVAPAPEPCIQEPVAIPEPVAVPVVEEAPAAEQPAAVAETVEATPEPVAQEPATIAEAAIPEQPAPQNIETAVTQEPIAEEPAATAEPTIVEQPAIENAETAPEPIPEEPAAIAEEVIVEQSPVENAEVVQPETVQVEVSPSVEEITTENPSIEAPTAAQTETTAEVVPEVSAETHPVSTMPSAKEVLPAVEPLSDSSEDKEE